MNLSHEVASAGKKQRLQQQPKKLRFITNHGAPHPKRRRVSAACFTCRKRKVACSGEKPACHTCSQNKVDCGGYNPNEVASGSVGSGESSKETTQPRAIKFEKSGRLVSPTISRNRPIPLPETLSSPSTFQSTPSKSSSSAPEHEATNHARLPERLPDISEEKGSLTSSTPLFSGPRNRMPYFRWLGPTAIMPGFKQMVVKVKSQELTNPHSSDHSSDGVLGSPEIHRTASVFSGTSIPPDDTRTPLALPFYDTSSMPPSELITHLCNTFFKHLGCNFPFLQREAFLKDLEEKQVDAILVDAVCAMAARFSTHDLLAKHGTNTPPSEYGSAFAQRAKEALIHTFATPNIAAVQAALLLAYNEFGESRDSGLWMYLGISIRLAQDLGLQKLDGLRYEGRDGPTPKMVKDDEKRRRSETRHIYKDNVSLPENKKEAEEQRAIERERVDTFWSVFFLDRVVSSGTGRRSTLRDKDIELSFPSMDIVNSDADWPSPFPPLIRIVHLYGRVTDLLNAIKDPSDITEDISTRLADMETRVTSFYQGLSLKLHFQAMNFHHYVKAGEGTNFVLLHFWFHTLIVLLHQPTLFKTFEGKMLQLFPNSQQLSMSSAKTIADILSYSQLIDAKACLGNPFTTQPIYIAACAFLKETAEQSETSKEQSRSQSNNGSRAASRAASPEVSSLHNRPTPGLLTAADRLIARHTLLATAASQHYQLCYKALESVETYWAGTKYILTVLDQKFKGVGDPLLYTAEEGECALERPNPKAEEAFKLPGWRRKFSHGVGEDLGLQGTWLGQGGAAMGGTVGGKGKRRQGGEIGGDVNQAIGWTLTGTLNSPSTNLAWHFPSGHGQTHNAQPQPRQLQNQEPIGKLLHPFNLPSTNTFGLHNNALSPAAHSRSTQYTRNRTWTGNSIRPSSAPHSIYDISMADAIGGAPVTEGHDMLINSSFPLSSSKTSTTNSHRFAVAGSSFDLNGFTFPSANVDTTTTGIEGEGGSQNGGGIAEDASFGASIFGDMFIESQDVDTSLLGLDTLPWFDALPTDELGDLEGLGDFAPLGGINEGEREGDGEGGE